MGRVPVRKHWRKDRVARYGSVKHLYIQWHHCLHCPLLSSLPIIAINVCLCKSMQEAELWALRACYSSNIDKKLQLTQLQTENYEDSGEVSQEGGDRGHGQYRVSCQWCLHLLDHEHEGQTSWSVEAQEHSRLVILEIWHVRLILDTWLLLYIFRVRMWHWCGRADGC